MKTIKLILIVMLVIVSGLYGYTILSRTLQGSDVPPVLESDREFLEISVQDDPAVLLTGVTASDEQDGDLTEDIQVAGISKLINDNTAKVTYMVFDSDHNMTTLVRPVRYLDYTSPRFQITEPLIYYRSESIALLDRLSATDVIDGDITDSIRASSMNPTSDPEIYLVVCQVTNSMGDTIFQELPVIRLDGIALRPEVQLREYLVYLEVGSDFDARAFLTGVNTPDGPGDISDVVLSGSVDTSTPGTYMVRYTYNLQTISGSSILTVVVE